MQAAFAARTPGAIFLAAVVAVHARRPVELAPEFDGALRAAPFDGAAASRMAERLDVLVPTWMDLAPQLGASATPAPVPTADIATASSHHALETSGCGAMQLRIALGSIQVNKRVDDVFDDAIYCAAQASDERSIEGATTEVTPPLGPGQAHSFSSTDGTFFGREAPRDPGERLNITYDCAEQDGAAEYQRLREAFEQLAQLARILSPQNTAFIASAAQAADIAARIAAAFDQDDRLFHADESLTRQDLWQLIQEPPRRLERSGTHNLSDWAWELQVVFSGCASESATPPTPQPTPSPSETPQPSPTPSPSPPPASTCDASNCSGCCVGTTCISNTTQQRCGARGAACYSCASHERCASGSCALDSQSLWSVTVVSANIDDRDEGGTCWDDAVGTCDDPPEAFLAATCGGRQGTTGVQSTWQPSWRTELFQVTADALIAGGMSVTVYDEDLTSDDTVATCSFSVPADVLVSGSGVLDCGVARSLTFEFGAR